MENMEQNKDAQQSGENGMQEPGKTFTQDEVNRIVQDRLAREKEKGTADQAKLEAREKELQKREAEITARELLKTKEMPECFLDVLNLSDVEKLPQMVELLHQGVTEYSRMHRSVPKGVQPGCSRDGLPGDPVSQYEREAFGLE